jgi:cytidine deaminase
MGHKRYNDATNAEIEVLLKNGQTAKQIHDATGVHLSGIYRKKQKLEAFGTVKPPPSVTMGRPRKDGMAPRKVAEYLDRDLIARASHALSMVPPNPDNHTVAAAARSTSGLTFTGANVFHFTGGPCAELVVLGAAAAGGVLAPDIASMVAVRRNSKTGMMEVINPCGRCRQVLLDYSPAMRVIVRDKMGKEKAVAVNELLPFAYVFEDERTEGGKGTGEPEVEDAEG